MNLSDNAYEEITQKINEADCYIFKHEVRSIIETMQSMGYVIVHPKWGYENSHPQWICKCGWKSIELIKGPCHNCGSGAALRRI
jgi:hypothetical protein